MALCPLGQSSVHTESTEDLRELRVQFFLINEDTEQCFGWDVTILLAYHSSRVTRHLPLIKLVRGPPYFALPSGTQVNFAQPVSRTWHFEQSKLCSESPAPSMRAGEMESTSMRKVNSQVRVFFSAPGNAQGSKARVVPTHLFPARRQSERV